MPTELNRIKELAGLQQEAAAISPNQIEAFKKWYATYSKMQSKDVYNYAKGIFKAYMETGVTELDGASKQDPRGKAYDDLAKIFPGMDGDIEAIGHQLKSQGVDPLDMEAQEESAVAEAPAGAEDAVDVAMKGMKPTKFIQIEAEIIGTIQDMMHQGGSYERVMDKIEDFITNEIGQQYVDKGIDIVKKAIQNKDEEMTFDDMINQIKSTGEAINSSVDDTIQRARAQIETLESALKEDYKKFQGMKPYKPKKK